MAARIEPTLLYPQSSQPVPAKQENRIRTIVADDSDSYLEVICDVLDLDDDIDLIGAACDGIEAINASSRLKPALVLMDVNMPGLDGISAASLLAEMRPAPIVVLMSSDDSRELRRACERAGAFAFIHKANFQQEFPNVIDSIYKMRDQQWISDSD
jgi:DNA-binding NarL/FixJ family response regulator